MTYVELYFPGIAMHFRPDNRNMTACGIVGPQYAAYDGRDVNCRRCRRTKAWRTQAGPLSEQKAPRPKLNHKEV